MQDSKAKKKKKVRGDSPAAQLDRITEKGGKTHVMLGRHFQGWPNTDHVLNCWQWKKNSISPGGLRASQVCLISSPCEPRRAGLQTAGVRTRTAVQTVTHWWRPGLVSLWALIVLLCKMGGSWKRVVWLLVTETDQAGISNKGNLWGGPWGKVRTPGQLGSGSV